MQLNGVFMPILRCLKRQRRAARVPVVLLLTAVFATPCDARQSPTTEHWPATLGAPVTDTRNIRRLDNNGFTIGYDTARQRAAWVGYAVTPVSDYRSMPRPPFVPDPRLTEAPDLSLYAGPDYDRGHLAPNYAIGQLYGVQAQQESFYYSNIAPQRPRFNQLVWQRLEELEIDAVAAKIGRLWVMLGPIAADNNDMPSAFYRIWIARTATGSWQSLAFVVPQAVRGDERLSDFVVSIDRIEAATGLDFFSGLDPRAERKLEALPAPASTFGFAGQACAPARYARRWQGRDGIRLRFDRCANR